MNFIEAIEMVKKGIKLKRRHDDSFFLEKEEGYLRIVLNEGDDKIVSYRLYIEDILMDDWEVYEEKQNGDTYKCKVRVGNFPAGTSIDFICEDKSDHGIRGRIMRLIQVVNGASPHDIYVETYKIDYIK